VDRLEDAPRRRSPMTVGGTRRGCPLWMAWLALAAVAAACTTTATPAAPTPENAAAVAEQRLLLEQELERLVAGEHAPGAVGALITPEGTVTAAVGVASLASSRLMSPDEPMPVASINKTFTAVVVLQLVAEGHLALDEPVEAWLPGILPGGERITVEHLLAHRSGVVDDDHGRPFDELVAEVLTEPCTATTTAESLDRAVAIPTSPPGVNYRYSNVGYVALGALIEAVTGRAYEDELQRRVFEPLDLSSAGFLVPEAETDAGVRGYLLPSLLPEEDEPVDVTCASFAGGAALADGGLVANASDIATFYSALLNGRLLEPEQLQLMQQAHSQNHGLGLELGRTACGPARGHSGLLPGFATRALASPNGDITLVLAMNGVGEWARTPPHDEAALRLYCALSRTSEGREGS
jgi:D-alanyl-D-alanine carboxypeptidase